MQVDFKVIKTKNSLLLQRKLTQKIIIATAVNFTIISFPKKKHKHIVRMGLTARRHMEHIRKITSMRIEFIISNLVFVRTFAKI